MSRAKRKEKQFQAVVKGYDVNKELPRPTVKLRGLNEKQDDCIIDLYESPCVIITGSAGTGKTYLAASVAAALLADKKIRNIVLTRANVGTGKSIGALPGDVTDKMQYLLMPVTDVLREKLGDAFYKMEFGKHINYQPFEFIRGRSFNDTVVICDEAQQLTIDELKAITTRIGRNSKLFLLGDTMQRDVRTNGLKWLVGLANKNNLPVDIHKFNSADIVRSELCRAFVEAFEDENNG
jgi:phosphate starvation-inducible PhoH-like protein